MSTNVLPKLMKQIRTLTPKQRSQLLNALAVPETDDEVSTGSGRTECPHCCASQPMRYGHVRGQQRWRCRACRRTFGLEIGAPVYGLHHKSAWADFTHAMNEGLTTNEAAKRCGIHRDTAARWRRRMLAMPKDTRSRQYPGTKIATTAGRPEKADNVVSDARVLRTHRALQNALLALIARKTFDEVSVRDITIEAGIGYATFFRHFSSKTELLNKVISEQIGQITSMALSLVEATDPRSACLLLCQFVSRERPLWAALLTGGAAGMLSQEFIREAREHGNVRMSNWLPLDLGVTHGVGATIEILSWWLRNPDQQTEEQIAGLLFRLVVQPILTGTFAMKPLLIRQHKL